MRVVTRASIVVCCLAVFPAVGSAQSPTTPTVPSGWKVPRTPDGRPDFSGVWANNAATPLERPKAFADREFLTDEEVKAMADRAARIFGSGADAGFGDSVFEAAAADIAKFTSRTSTGDYSSVWLVPREFDNRTSLISDPGGRLPPLTQLGQDRQAATAARRGRIPDGPEDLTLQVRCITYGVPRVGGLAAGYNSYYQFFQSRDAVAIASEMIHDVRLVPTTGQPHPSGDVRQWHGISRGRWEGDTLVVETKNFSARSNFYGASDGLHVVERFTRVDADTIHDEITVTDPSIWTRPWTAVIHLKKSQDRMYEYACHEGNESMIGILSGARSDERRAGSR